MESNESPVFVREPVKLMELTVTKLSRLSQHTLQCSGNKLPCRSRFFTNQLNAMAAGVEHMYAYHHGESFTVQLVTA